jgi:nucleoid-associated protein YgaU
MFVRFVFVTFLALVLAWSVLARVSEGAGSGQPYRVEAGDTLWSIAEERYDGDPREGVWAIQRENGLGGSALVPGEVLVLP